MVSSVKPPILKKGEYILWTIKMEQYLAHTYYALWEVILNGNSAVQMTKDEAGNQVKVPPVTAQQILVRIKERKAKSTLLMAILDEHLARLYIFKDAKTLWATIKTRFSGNAKSKKMQKNVLKQQFEIFSVSNSEGLDKGYDRFQRLFGLLEIHRAGVSTENENKKFLRSLPLAWSNISLIMRNKPGIDNLDIDDLYNNLKVYEADIKGSFASSSNSQNVAFVSIESTSSTNELNAAYSIFTATCHSSQAQARNTGNRSRDARNVGYKERDNEEEATDFALMAFTSNPSSSSSSNYEEEFTETGFDNRSSDGENSLANDRFKKGKGYHPVPPTLTGNYMAPKSNLSFAGLDDSIYKFKISETVTSLTKDEKDAPKTSTACVEKPKEDKSTGNYVKPVKSVKPVKHVKPVKTAEQIDKSKNFSSSPMVDRKDWHGKMTKRKETGHKESRPVWNNGQRINHQNNFVPTIIFTRSGRIPVSAAKQKVAASTSASKPVNTAGPKQSVNFSKLRSTFNKSHSPIRRSFYNTTTHSRRNSTERVNTAGSKAVSAVKENRVTDVKNSAGCVWRPRINDIDQIFKDNRWICTRVDYVDPQGHPHQALKNKEIVDSGCSRYMTGNKAYLADYREINDGGFVAFGSNRGKITGKGKIRIEKLDFDDVYFVNELQFNLFFVSQIFDLKDVVPSRDLTCLFAKASIDESNLWHKRLDHVNFKTMNKLVKGNLVISLPSKIFENDHTCVACQKGKQHKATLTDDFIRDLDEFYGMKGIKREYSNARTLHQNGVAERKNRTLIEASRTMLAYSLLLITFWAEAVNTACYVLNRA
uniref:Uncharacterized protein n=1 Tax=Tanacetum cinerariifolium TaxID=118510 RepID=A0A6L2ML54_TANCI|nr:hypothetical protein [Tanacetum cinerariifolium]